MISRFKHLFSQVLIGIFIAMAISSFAQLQSPLDIALRHLEQNRNELQLTTTDISNYYISDLYTSKHNGVTHVYLYQTHKDIPVHNAIININILPNGKVLNMGNRFVADLKSRVNSSSPSITPEQAIQKVIDHFQINTSEVLRLQEKESDHHYIFKKDGIALEPIPVKLAYEPMDDKSVRLSWNVKLYELDAQHWWIARVDAQTGALLAYDDRVIHCDFSEKNGTCEDESHSHGLKKAKSKNNQSTTKAQSNLKTGLANSYNVFPMPIESPNHGDRELVVDPADPVASPLGWHDTDGVSGPEYTITRGNNVHAYHDIFSIGASSDDEPDGGSSLDFDFPLDLSLNQPYTQIPPAVVNLFYWNNIIHDVWYQYGFDEESGNFQASNYGNGGVGGDWVRAEGLDGGGIDNANFATPEDGNPPRMQMYIWTDGNPLPDIDPAMLTVTAPMTVEGDYGMEPAGFGGNLPINPIVSEVVLVDDTIGVTSDACEPIINGAEIAGKVAMIDRGDCQFGTKILSAENEGAIAVIICNNVTSPATITMAPGVDGDQVTIPSVMVSLQDCNVLKTGLPGLTISLGQPEYEIPLPGPTGLDGDFDNGIIVHEYTHGISNRLTGGPSNTGCLNNPEQAGEGWSDWFALVMLTTTSNTAEQGRGMGTYALNQPVDGEGIRIHPYSRDMNINPHTYGDYNNVFGVHAIGSIWAAMIWDLYWNMIDAYGFDEDFYNGTGGNNKTMQLVLDGLKLQSCDPTFVDARDAILAADEANYDGVNQCLIWETFARRGLGYSAQAGGNEAFDLPDQCRSILKVSKTAVEEVFAGEVIEYTLEITNDSPDLLSNTTVHDTLPTGTSYVAGSASCSNTTVDSGVLSIEIGSMATGESITCTYQLLVDDIPFTYSVLEDGIENGTANWETITDLGTIDWVTDPNSYEGNFAWFAENTASPSDLSLIIAQPFNLDGPNPALSFWHRYATEGNWDGGVVEISTDAGQSWIDLGDKMFQNGYNGTLNDNTPNPLTGRPAFTGGSNGFIETIIDLSDYVQQDILFRFRLGCDDAVGADGWYIDNITLLGDFYSITNTACVSSNPDDIHCSDATTVIYGDITDTKTVIEAGLKVAVFPNPANNNVFVKMNSIENSPTTISLLNINGQLLYTEDLDYSTGSYQMDLSTYPQGIYMIQVRTNSAQVLQKVLKQ